MDKDLLHKLQSWDGKHSAPLIQIYKDYQGHALFFEDLVDICLKYPDLQVAATWILKHHFDQKKHVDHDLINQLLREGKSYQGWETRIHMLQILPNVVMKEETVPYVEEWVRKAMRDDNKFVRAWSYQGMYEVSRHIPEMKEELKLLCEDALELESASVKARVRKVLKQLAK